MSPLTPSHLLDRYYLEMRARCLSLAADLDRIQRGGGEGLFRSDQRLLTLAACIRLLTDGEGDRARRVQDLLSDHTPPPP
jgi:hypothetical protein